MNNMDSDFKNYVKRNVKKDKATHVVPNIGSFTIEKKNMERFQIIVIKNFENDKKYQITEMFGDICTFVMDLRFEI